MLKKVCLIVCFLAAQFYQSQQQGMVSSTRYKIDYVESTSWANMELRANSMGNLGGLYCSAVCTKNQDCHAYYFDSTTCYEASSTGLIRANPNSPSSIEVYYDIATPIPTTTTTTTTSTTSTSTTSTTPMTPDMISTTAGIDFI